MSKYSEDFKLMVVKEYQEGKLGFRTLAKKHGIKGKSAIHRWVKIYEKFGQKGLSNKEHNEYYPVQLKRDILSYIKRTGSSETEAALHFGLINPNISTWKKVFSDDGGEDLKRPEGRIPMSNRNKDQQDKKNEMTYEQKLERENELLRLEVEYLKKLRAFQMDPENYLEKHKQHYHSNSKKPS
ncbi:helix-turn-helix domain-containing protein, partial [Bacillus sp. PS06]|uniref:helix-turn-helix domain-containing protein n=1 Tax=Bacillus sp. PS06 TaxID=2764176 RepID=UPI00177ED5BF